MKREPQKVQGVVREAISQECGFERNPFFRFVLDVRLRLSVILFFKFTSSERLRLWVDVELNRNVRSVCLASRSTVRLSGGLKSSWGRAVGRHSSATFLYCYSHQTAFNNQSLFAEIRIGLDRNAAQHSAPDKISLNAAAQEIVLWCFLI